MNKQHIESIQIIADGLGDLLPEVVFVGGAVTEFYTSDTISDEARISDDIDCVIEISSKKEYYELERRLEIKGFKHDTSQGAPICRWLFNHVLVDIMPTDDEILGFSNLWYPTGIELKIERQLPNGTTIFLFPPEVFLASKIEALNSRGRNDLRQSTDFEDIVFILDNSPEILTTLKFSKKEVKDYLRIQFTKLLARADIIEGIECALPYSADKESVERILNILQFE